MNMNDIALKSLLLSVPLFTFVAHAELYKGLDAEGNVFYSDQPFHNAEKFIPPSLSIADAPKAKQKKKVTEEEKPAEFKYTDFDIISPTNNQTIWNEPQLNVTLQLKPGLNTAEGHTAWLIMDGKPVVENSQSTSMQIGQTDRGAHQLQAQVRDKEGKIVVRSRAIIVHIKKSVVRRPAL
ncbi:MAG: DUF4124 domain-containing protein [Gammaproteobacteria bacterium]|nr:DUF4124 domain-containing protein [Gammaproteobacteria bacterium]